MNDIKYNARFEGERLEGAMKIFLENYDIEPDVPVVVDFESGGSDFSIKPRTSAHIESIITNIHKCLPTGPKGLFYFVDHKQVVVSIDNFSYHVFYEPQIDSEGERK